MIFKTPAAEDDLINLWRYIARDNPPATDRVHHSAEKTFEAIADMPGIGTAYRSKRAKLHGLRFFPLTQYPNYVVYYREIDNGIEIVRVLHAHMKKERRLET